MKKLIIVMFVILLPLFFTPISAVAGNELKVKDLAPAVKLKTHEGKDFDLSNRKGQWTVLYFYPKAGTPGCTKQACAFRDSLDKIKEAGAEVFGVSSDSVDAQAKFHKEHRLNFILLADHDSKIIEAYGVKVPVIGVAKRWTFIIDPELKIRAIIKGADPVVDSETMAQKIIELKK